LEVIRIPTPDPDQVRLGRGMRSPSALVSHVKGNFVQNSSIIFSFSQYDRDCVSVLVDFHAFRTGTPAMPHSVRIKQDAQL